MQYPKSNHYNSSIIQEKFMGPNPLKLQEELLLNHKIPAHATVMDLGSGQGVTSVFLAKEYGFLVFATDLWSNPTDNMHFFTQMGLTSEQIIPIHAEATALPYAQEFFDAVISTDSYHYFGRDPQFLGKNILPYLKHGGFLYAVVPGMKKDLHSNLPPELLLSWSPEDLDYIHDIPYWEAIIRQTEGIRIDSIHEMEINQEAWNDWLACDNVYARGDRKAINAGGCQYLNFIAITVQKL